MKKQQKDKKVKKDRREKLRYIREVSAEQRGRILLSCLTGILGKRIYKNPHLSKPRR